MELLWREWVLRLAELTDEQKELLKGLTDSQIDKFQEKQKSQTKDFLSVKVLPIRVQKDIRIAKRNKILYSVNDASEHCWSCDQPIIELVEEEVK